MIVYLLLFAAVILGQVQICKQKSPWPGLGLPLMAFLAVCFGHLGLYLSRSWMTPDWKFILGSLLLWNIPTYILLAIYWGSREKFRQEKELEEKRRKVREKGDSQS